MKQLSPMEANEIDDICRMESDNYESGDFRILQDGVVVSLGEQKVGQNPTQVISMRKANFNQLIEWYIKKQNLKRKR